MKPEKQISEELNRINYQFDNQVDELNTELKQEYNTLRQKGYSEEKAFSLALKSINYESRLIELTALSSVSSVEARYQVKDVQKLKEWIADKIYPMDIIKKGDPPVKFSKVIHKNIKLLQKEVKESIITNQSWTSAANKISKKNIKADIPKYLKDLLKAAKKADISPEDYRIYKRALKKAMANIKKLALEGAPTEYLKKSYQNLVNIVIQNKDKNLKKAIDRAIRNKAKYYAQRVQRTEIIRMNTATKQIDLDRDNDAVGWGVRLNSRHKITDECDFHAGSDLYGLGAGCFPKWVPIQIPWHTHCFCIVYFIYRKDVERAAFSKKRGAEWLMKHPKKAKGMMNKKDYEKFIKKPQDWEKFVRGWSDVFVDLPRIPKGVLGKRK